MDGIHNYIFETNHVARVYSVVDVQYLQFVLLAVLFRPWITFCVIINLYYLI